MLNKKYIYLIFAFLIVLYLFALDNRLSRNGDDALFVILAESIAKGHGLSEINDPDMPAHTIVPPLFPLLLAPLVYFFPKNFFIYKLLVFISAVLSFFFFYKIFIKRTSKKNTIIILLLTYTSLLILNFSTTIMTEMPYLLLSSFFFFFLISITKEGKKERYLF